MYMYVIVYLLLFVFANELLTNALWRVNKKGENSVFRSGGSRGGGGAKGARAPSNFLFKSGFIPQDDSYHM